MPKIGHFYFITLNCVDAPLPSSVAMRMVWVPIGAGYVNTSPDLVVPIVLSFKNQNILANGLVVMAINDIGAVLASDTITVRVPLAGDTIIGAGGAIVSKSHPGINGGGVLRVMPARMNMSRY